jgi:hypothetical protein
VFIDYRCHAPGRLLGTNLPPGVEPFLRRIDKMDAKTVFDFYGMSHPDHAVVLKQRVADLLDGRGGTFHHVILHHVILPVKPPVDNSQ